jgi:hypothetical protein
MVNYALFANMTIRNASNGEAFGEIYFFLC